MAGETGIPGPKDKFQPLRDAYRVALPQRLAEIGACWNDVRRADDDAGAWDKFHRLVHSLAGSAGTFGFSALGEKAQELEQLLVEHDGHRTDRPNAEIEDCLARFRSLMEQQDAAGRPIGVATLPAASRNGENHQLVVIEDDQFLAREIAEQLSRFGWEVRLFHNADDAAAALQGAEPPAGVIVDIVLPEGRLAGTSLMQQMRDAAGAPIPHIVISRRWDWESRLEAARAGAAAYLVKPIDFGVLAERLDVLTRRRMLRSHRVLIVEDMAILAAHYAAVLGGAGMNVMTIGEPSRLLESLTEFEPDLILMDLYMPGCSGVEAARVVRQDPTYASVPIVFLSTEPVRDLQLAAMRIGADDFLQKPIRDDELIATVSMRAARFREIATLIRQDSLTRLANNISFKLRLESEIERSRRAQSTLTLAMIDIDRFKGVNDTYGHLVGDHVIQALAALLHRRLRRSDLPGRYGGEEFAVMMPDTAMQSAVQVIDGLREHFASIRHVSGDEPFHCTFSAGVAAMPPSLSMDELIRAADTALYEAKRAGRNCIRGA